MSVADCPASLLTRSQSGSSKGPHVDAENERFSDSDQSTEFGTADTDIDLVETETMKQLAVDTLIIFDYDDTLFPTSWLLQEGLLEEHVRLNPEQIMLLQSLEKHVIETLQTTMQYGRIVIITNATQGWVEHSCSIFMPSLASFLTQFDIVSARSTYESPDADSPTEWKTLAFAREVRRLWNDTSADDLTCQRTIISLGDSLCEHQALVAAVETFHCTGKSLNFVEQPDIVHLLDQHDLIHGCFADVCEHVGGLDLEVAAPP